MRSATHRFRRGYVLQGNDINNLPYRSGFFPLGPIFAFVLCLIITLRTELRSVPQGHH
ncbi:hypothetical protein LNQ52_19145 [Klebsiella pneumoniae subsp. pneumoniae]|nr:hypothetical protein [Klebsiella pneumoniae subsp. pneumoniae]